MRWRRTAAGGRSRFSAATCSALDLGTVALSILAVVALVGNDFRVSLGGLTLSMKSWWRVALWAGLIALLRHVISPTPSLAARIRHRTERWGWPAGFHGVVLSAGVGSRIAILIVAFFAASMIGPAYGRSLPARPGSLPVLAAIGCFLWALLYLYRLARFDLDSDRAVNAVALLAAWPFAIFFSVSPVDSVILLAAAGAFYHLRRDEYGRAGTWSFIGGIGYPTGWFLSIPLLILAFSKGRGRPDTSRKGLALGILAALVAPLGLFVSRTLLSFFEPAFRPLSDVTLLAPVTFNVQSLSATGQEWLSVGLLRTLEHRPLEALNLATVGFVFALLWPVARRFGAAYASLLAAGLIAALLFDVPISPGRATAVLFPVFFYIASKPRLSHWAWVACSAMVQAVIACAFFTGRGSF